jgi:uncharacterized membrane-anchored protein
VKAGEHLLAIMDGMRGIRSFMANNRRQGALGTARNASFKRHMNAMVLEWAHLEMLTDPGTMQDAMTIVSWTDHV